MYRRRQHTIGDVLVLVGWYVGLIITAICVGILLDAISLLQELTK